MIKKNLFSILVSLLLLYLSLANSATFDRIKLSAIPHIDKVVHFGMYFLLMSVIIAEHRKRIRNLAGLLLLALIPVSYGVLMEIMQYALTTTRTGDIYDALADAAGVLASLTLWILIKPLLKLPVR